MVKNNSQFWMAILAVTAIIAIVIMVSPTIRSDSHKLGPSNNEDIIGNAYLSSESNVKSSSNIAESFSLVTSLGPDGNIQNQKIPYSPLSDMVSFKDSLIVTDGSGNTIYSSGKDIKITNLNSLQDSTEDCLNLEIKTIKYGKDEQLSKSYTFIIENNIEEIEYFSYQGNNEDVVICIPFNGNNGELNIGYNTIIVDTANERFVNKVMGSVIKDSRSRMKIDENKAYKYTSNLMDVADSMGLSNLASIKLYMTHGFKDFNVYWGSSIADLYNLEESDLRNMDFYFFKEGNGVQIIFISETAHKTGLYQGGSDIITAQSTFNNGVFKNTYYEPEKFKQGVIKYGDGLSNDYNDYYFYLAINNVYHNQRGWSSTPSFYAKNTQRIYYYGDASIQIHQLVDRYPDNQLQQYFNFGKFSQFGTATNPPLGEIKLMHQPLIPSLIISNGKIRAKLDASDPHPSNFREEGDIIFWVSNPNYKSSVITPNGVTYTALGRLFVDCQNPSGNIPRFGSCQIGKYKMSWDASNIIRIVPQNKAPQNKIQGQILTATGDFCWSGTAWSKC